jgi:uncharacterized protein YndB with AHSA1/START domain
VIGQIFKKQKDLRLERSYPAPLEAVWQAWTEADRLRRWWGPEQTTVPECEIDLRVGGRIYVVTEAGAEMGKYQGTRWPMEGTFTQIDPHDRLVWEARSWTEGEEASTTICHTNDLTLVEADGLTTVRLHVTITDIGPKAKLAAFGMKMGYKQHLEKLAAALASDR